MNIDPKEKEKFNKIAEEWWDPSGKFAPLHKINPLRADYIAERTELKNKQILDVACGGGLLAEALSLKGGNLSGVDISDVAIHTAKNHANKENIDINYILGEAENLLPEKNEHFDVVTCLEAIEHVPDPNQLVKTCPNLCKKNGHIFFQL